MSRAEWCFRRSEILKDAAELEAELTRKSQLLGMARQWTLAGDIASHFTVWRGSHGILTVRT